MADKAASIDWAAVRAAFEAGEGGFTALGKRFGLTAVRISRRAKRDGWRVADTEGPPLMRRIEMILDQEASLAQRALEKALTGDEATSAADDERRARTLNMLLRTYERIAEMKRQILTEAKEKAAKAAPDAEEALSADDIRAEIKRRLDRLLAADLTGKVSKKS